MYRNKLWPQYQSILYLSTRNKSFIPSVLLSVEPYLCFCGKCHISNLVCLRTRLGVSNTPLSAPFFGTFAPSLSFQPTTLCSPCLWVFVLFLLDGWLLCWMVVSSMVFFLIEFLVCSRWVRTVFYILLSTYQCSTHGAVKYWRYHSTMASTVQQYLHCSTSLFWLQYSWWCQVLGVPQYKVPWRLPYNSATTVLLFHPALSWCIVQYLQYSFIVVISLHFKGGVFPVVMLVGAFVSCLLSHIFFLLFCIPIRMIVTTSGVVCLNLFLCFNGIHASSACVLRLSV